MLFHHHILFLRLWVEELKSCTMIDEDADLAQGCRTGTATGDLVHADVGMISVIERCALCVKANAGRGCQG